VSGGSLAVARHGKLVLVRGYGFANRERGIPVEPSSMFRLASLSKTVTAVAVLQLVQEGRLGLDDKVLPILDDLGPRPGRITDARVRDITVRHLLQHSGGWSRTRSGDVVFMPGAADAAKRQRGPLPPDCPTVLRDTLERQLDFTPGDRFAYSNVGYCILGRVIERVTGTAYEAHVRTRVLAPAGVAGMKIGRTLDAAAGEVTYYDFEAKTVRAVPGLGLKVAPRPYGEFVIETMDAFGGWIGTPADYLRFILAIDGRRGPPLLNLATLAQMNAPSRLPTESSAADDLTAKGTEYALGTYVRQRQDGGVNLWHSGSLPGTSALAVRAGDGFVWVAVFNGRPENRYAWRAEIDRGLWAARGKVRNWPDGDLFR
jgi:N-acyl-D-amino-acid deacylase